MTRSGAEGAAPATLVEALRRSAEGPSSGLGFSFLADGDEVTARLTYEQLDRRARAIGAGIARSSKAGDRAVLVFPPGLEFVEGLFGCFYGGVVAVPAPWQRPGRSNPQLGAIVEDSGATLALTTRAVLKLRDRFVEGEPRLGPLRWLAVEDLDQEGDPTASPGPDDLAFLQYTSGSTSAPKGVMLPHRAALANVEAMRRLLGLDPGKVGVCWLPPFHDMGLIGNILQVVHTGMDLVLMPPAAFVQEPLRWLRAIGRFGASVGGGPNFAFDLCARTIKPADREGLDLRSWEVAYVGAEPVSPRTLGRFADAFAGQGFRPEAFYPCYGLAEATLMVTGGDRSARPVVRRVRRDELSRGRVVEATGPEDDPEALAFAGCGRALPGSEVRIIDPSTGEPVEAGRVGEIWVSGPSVGDGYWGRPEATDELFRARPTGSDDRTYLRTGDSGFLDGEELFVSGRLKDMIIIRGKNHYPQDIEEVAAAAHPALKPGTMVAFGSEHDGEARLELLAEVSRHHDDDESGAVVEAIRRAVAEQLGLEAQAVTLARASSLPKTSSGKSRRQECRRLALAGGLDVVHRWAAEPRREEPGPRSPGTRREVRDWLVARIGRHLDTSADRISTTEPFANFGLDSISMVTISAELGELLGSPLSPTLLYDAPTIDALAEAVGETGPSLLPSPVGWVETQHPPGAGSRPSQRDSFQASGDGMPLTAGPFPEGRGEEEGAGSRAIAIIGGGCRFPGADSLEAFWELLREGRDAVGPIPEGRRWSRPPGPIASEAGGFLPEVDQFDAGFFGISPREAAYVDPQHRLLLEVAWEALEEAGIKADGLAGRPVGAFVGIAGSDYGRMLGEGPGLADSYWGTGNSASMAANRLSYHLDLAGPSLSVDTACSSSLVAVHLAVRSLRDGECELALAAGVNLMLAPEVSVALTRANMLSPTGRCRSFDAQADGYARGEGCGVAVLKPLAAALRDGDRVLAVIRGSAINQDGKSNGITAPNGGSQTALIRAAIEDAGASPGEIGCVEAHGSGTILGDPIEVDALKAALGEGPLPCAIATVKTNLGHLEAAAGVAGLLKAALQLDRGLIARHLHHESTNPHIQLEGTRFFIPDEAGPWTSDGRRLAGVSSFGFGGTNAHVVLEAARPTPASPETSRPSHLLTISARSAAALRVLAGRYVDRLSGPLSSAEVADVCHTAATGRVHFPHRLAIRADSAENLRDALAAFLAGRPVDGLHQGEARRDADRRVAFLFTGQGSQHAGMGLALYRSCPPFREAIGRVDAALGRIGEPPVGRAFEADLLNNNERPACPQVALFALEYALAETWRAWGVVPAFVLGHSLGEYAAACVAGVFGLEDGLRLVAGRARLMTGLCQPGAMAAVFAPFEVVEGVVALWADSLAVAAINGPANVAISGSRESVLAATEEFRRRGVSSQAIAVPLAYHSPLIEPALAAFGELAARVRFAAPTIPLVSNLTGRLAVDEVRDPAYWCRHARRPVRFLEGLRQLRAVGVDTFVEVGPTGTLSALAQVGLPDEGLAFAPSMRKGRDDWRALLDALGVLETRGVPVDWRGFDAGEARRKVSLPTYPFERQRHWFSADPRSASKARAPLDPRRIAWESRTRWDFEIDHPPAPDLPGLAALSEGLEPLALGLFNDRNPSSRPGQKADFDRLAAGYAVAALRDLGWEPALGERVEAARLAERLGVPAKLHRFFGRMVRVLGEEGYLGPIDGGWEVVAVPDRVDMPAMLAETLGRHPEWAGELTLAGRCGEALGRVLKGAVDPLEILFPGGSATLLEGLYEDSPVARLSNRVVARAIGRAVEAMPADRTVRILELGAGTGGTTSHVLPGLPPGRCEYVFSDVSALFLGRAREKFAAFDFLEYRALDLEADLASSGLASHQFDVILAANVLHATADLRRTLASVRRLLAPSGLLVLLEGTGPQRLPDLVFGMAEGWWKFTDVDLRGAHPLLPRRAWVELLESEGFAEAAALPGLEGEGEPDQAVILARGPAVVEGPFFRLPLPLGEGRGEGPGASGGARNGTISGRNGHATSLTSRLFPPEREKEEKAGLGWLIFSDGEVGPVLADRLELAGEPFLLVKAADAPAWLADDDGFRQRLDSATKELDRPRLGVVHLWGLGPASSLTEALGLGLGLLIRIDRADAESAIDRAWLVTRGGTTAGRFPDEADPAQEALWGLGQARAHPDRATKRVDLDPRADAGSSARRLAREILSPDDRDTLAYRGDRRLAARAEPPKPAGPTEEGTPAPSPTADDGPTIEELRAAGPGARLELLGKILRSELGRVLSIEPGSVAVDIPVNSLGLDSLMAIQLKNRIELRTGVTLSIITLLEGLSLAQISAKMDEEIVAGDDRIGGSFKPVNGKGHDPRPDRPDDRHDAAPGRSTLDQMVADLDLLPESELDSLLDDLIGPDGFGDDGDDDRPS